MNDLPARPRVTVPLGETLPASWYADPGVFAKERAAIFARHWQLFAHESRMPNPGDYVAGMLAGYPIVVIRGRDGQVRGFHNVCRHRAAQLVPDGVGHSKSLVCPYHGWSYDGDGRLIKARDFGEDPGLDPAAMGLFPLRTETWKGLVFVCLDRNGPSLVDWLGPIAVMAKDYPLEKYRFYRDKIREVDVDWKAYGDNYLEGYHLELMHPALCAAIDVGQYTIDVHDQDAFFHLYGPRRDGGLTQGLYFYRFPVLMLNLYDWGASIATIDALGPGRMRHTNWYLFEDLSPEGRAERDRIAEWAIEIVSEDIAIVTGVQRNLNTGVYDRGRLSPKHEHGLKGFHDMVRRGLADYDAGWRPAVRPA
jgi:choline monooxygenase